MQYSKVFTVVSLLLVPFSLAAPSPLDARACAYTCGSTCYSSSAANAAKEAGYNLYSEGETAGSNDYPHVYHDYEGFDFPVDGTYYEFPILSSGETYDGGSPGADRVVFNTNDELAGLITHNGASGDDFVQCT